MRSEQLLRSCALAVAGLTRQTSCRSVATTAISLRVSRLDAFSTLKPGRPLISQTLLRLCGLPIPQTVQGRDLSAAVAFARLCPPVPAPCHLPASCSELLAAHPDRRQHRAGPGHVGAAQGASAVPLATHPGPRFALFPAQQTAVMACARLCHLQPDTQASAYRQCTEHSILAAAL